MEYDNFIIDTKDGVSLHAWLIKSQSPQTSPTIVMFHENAGNIGHRMETYYNMQQRLGVNIFTFDYRGYNSKQLWQKYRSTIRKGDGTRL
jgi:dipeptidyl aminopeptidase/acylaminoacyl peptidase